MDSLKDLGAKDVVTALQDYFSRSMLQMSNDPGPRMYGNPNIRNEAYYAKQEPIHDDFIRCPNCGHAVEAPGDQY